MIVAVTVTIDRPAPVVERALTRPEERLQWITGLRDCQIEPPGRVEPGARYREIWPNGAQTVSILDALEPGRLVAWIREGPPPETATVTLRSALGQTVVDLEWARRLPRASRLVAPMIRRRRRLRLLQESDRLQGLLSSGA